MYPIRQFKCFLIIVLCTFTALQSIPSSISSFIGRLKYWSLTDKSKHHNLTRVSWWVSERAVLVECTGGRSSCQPLSLLLPLFVNRICLLLWDVYVKPLQSDRWLIWPSLLVTPPVPHSTPILSTRPPVSFPSINPPMTFCRMQHRGSRGASDDCRCLNCCQRCQDNSDLSP